MKILLPKGYQPGRLINYNGNVYKIIRHLQELDYLPGGKGIMEMELEFVTKGVKTEKELKVNRPYHED